MAGNTQYLLVSLTNDPELKGFRTSQTQTNLNPKETQNHHENEPEKT